jgi:EPS-associated MarR family transcriptional regulator
MNTHEQEIRYRLLKILSQESNLSQRDMAKQMGISLGKVNYCLSELAKRGLIDVIRFKSAKNKIPYTYVLTPRGMKEKARLTVNFLKRKMAEYEDIQRQIAELSREVQEDRVNGISPPETSDVFSRVP